MNSGFIISMLIGLYHAEGHDAFVRAITPSDATIRAACAKTKVDPTQALADRDKWAQDTVQMIQDLALGSK